MGNNLGFVDIHTHILPGVDDGAADTEQAKAMVRMAYQDGTRCLFLTPHYRGRYRKYYDPEKLRNAFCDLRQALAPEFPELRLILGSEVTYEADAPELLSEGKILSLCGTEYVLLELFSKMPPSQVLNAVSETIRYGFVPILAHVDRYEVFRKEKGLIDEVLGMGALIQLNADSVLGSNGFWVKRFCHKLIRAGKVHFIASDAHDLLHRTPSLQKCYRQISKKYGKSLADDLFCRNTIKILENCKETL